MDDGLGSLRWRLPVRASVFHSPAIFKFSENFKTMKTTYTLFTIHFENPMHRKDEWLCRSVIPVTTGLTLQQAADVAKCIFSYTGHIPGPDGEPWEEHLISCVVPDGCTLPKRELVIPTAFAMWDKHHHHLALHAEVL